MLPVIPIWLKVGETRNGILLFRVVGNAAILPAGASSAECGTTVQSIDLFVKSGVNSYIFIMTSTSDTAEPTGDRRAAANLLRDKQYVTKLDGDKL